jgi:hypothetical protein
VLKGEFQRATLDPRQKSDFGNQLLVMQRPKRTKIANCALLCWRIRLTHASAKTKDLTSVTCRSPAVDGQSCHFRGSASHLVGDYFSVNIHRCANIRVPHQLLLNGYRSRARKSPISDSENKGVGFGTAVALSRVSVSWPFRVLGANVGCKLFVALQLEVAHHFIE